MAEVEHPPGVPNPLIPTSEETVFLSSGREALVPQTRPTFEGWTGAFTGSTYGGKPLLDFDGQPLFAELVILRLFQRDGWDGVNG